jgi:nucleoside-diphosphate-sugar epimerase
LGWLDGLPVSVVRGSYYDVDSLREAVGSVDYVFHIAGVTKARKAREYNDGNVLSTRNLLNAAAGNPHLRKFCFVSSQAAVGPSLEGKPVDETSPCNPITTYGVTKLEAETLCQLHADRVPITIVRPPAVYGPRDTDILNIFAWAKKGVVLGLGSREKRMSLIYGPELARAIIDVTVSEKTTGETYFAADEMHYSYVEVLTIATRLFGKKPRTIVVPKSILYSLAAIAETISLFAATAPVLNLDKVRDLVQKEWTCSTRKIEEHVGFRSQVTIQEGLEKTLAWYAVQGWL